MPSSSSTSAAAFIVGQSLCDPMMIPTCAIDVSGFVFGFAYTIARGRGKAAVAG
jgi:hypothetical protein